MVPGKGVVAGALYYFPFQDERETLPAEGAVASQPEPITTYNMTQQPLASQLPTQAAPPSDGVPPKHFCFFRCVVHTLVASVCYTRGMSSASIV